MHDPHDAFERHDRGLISRRALVQLLGVAAVAAPLRRVVAQGSCGGANAGSPRCNTTPFPPPFAPTGWKTVALDHFSMQVVDYQKEAAYYAALMGWKVRSDDGSKAVLDIGDWGQVVIRGGERVACGDDPCTCVAVATPAAVACAALAVAARPVLIAA